MKTLTDKKGRIFNCPNLIEDVVWPNLQFADFSFADLSQAKLDWADLTGALFYKANLQVADLRFANLQRVRLQFADLQGTNLYKADLQGAVGINPAMMLLAHWGFLEDETIKLAMMYDCANLENGKERFQLWFKTGDCPFSDSRYQRACNFYEVRVLWDENIPLISALELMKRIFKEKLKAF